MKKRRSQSTVSNNLNPGVPSHPPQRSHYPKNKKIRINKFDNMSWEQKDIVIKCMLENMPELNLTSHKIMYMLRLFYISNHKYLTALEKLVLDNNPCLSQKDILPFDDSVEIQPVHYPTCLSEHEKTTINQMLTDKQSDFLNNVRNGMEKKEAFSAAGFSPTMTNELLLCVTQPDPKKFETQKYGKYKKLWVEYWKIKKQQSEASGITEDYILSNLKKTSDFNVKELFDTNGNLKNINDLDDDTAKQVQEIKISESKITNNKKRETTTITRTLSIKVGNKDNARKELAKLQQGIFAHVNTKTINHNVSGGLTNKVLDVNKLSKSQLDKILMIDQQNSVLELDSELYNNEDIIDGEIIDEE